MVALWTSPEAKRALRNPGWVKRNDKKAEKRDRMLQPFDPRGKR